MGYQSQTKNGPVVEQNDLYFNENSVRPPNGTKTNQRPANPPPQRISRISENSETSSIPDTGYTGAGYDSGTGPRGAGYTGAGPMGTGPTGTSYTAAMRRDPLTQNQAPPKAQPESYDSDSQSSIQGMGNRPGMVKGDPRYASAIPKGGRSVQV